jgi:hypothetical protein
MIVFCYSRSLRDGIMYMMKWSESNSYITPFTMEQLPTFFINATNVNITSVLEKWLQSNQSLISPLVANNASLLSYFLAFLVCLSHIIFFHIPELN